MKYKALISVIVVVASVFSVPHPNSAAVVEAQKERQPILISVPLPKARHATPAPNILRDGSAVLSNISQSMQEDVFYLGNEPLVRSNIARRISLLLKNRPPNQQVVYLHSHLTERYGAVAAILNSIREAGVERIGLITQQDSNDSLATFEVKIAKKARPLTPNVFFIEVMPGGVGPDQRVKLNDKAIELSELSPALKALLKLRRDKGVVIKAPAEKPYTDVVWVIDTIKGAGAHTIELQIDHLINMKRPPQGHIANSGITPLIAAVKKDDIAAVKSLLARGADINSADKTGRSPLIYAAEWGHTEIARLLLDKGAGDINVALRRVRNAEIARLLLAKGADVNGKDKAGFTPLMSTGDLEIVQLLLARGADVNARNKDGSTPLMAALYYGNRKVIQTLLAKGADVNARDNDGKTALTYALQMNDREIADLLKKAGAKQ